MTHHTFNPCEGTSPDQYHDRCKGSYVSASETTIRCGCPNHEWPNDEETN